MWALIYYIFFCFICNVVVVSRRTKEQVLDIPRLFSTGKKPLPEALVTGVIETDRNFDLFSDQQCKCTQDYGYIINYNEYITRLELDPEGWRSMDLHHRFFMKCTKCVSEGNGQPNEEKEMFRVNLYWLQWEKAHLSIILTLSVLSCHDNIKYSITFYQKLWDRLKFLIRTPEKTCQVVTITDESHTVSDCTTVTVPEKVERPWLPTYPWKNNWRDLENIVLFWRRTKVQVLDIPRLFSTGKEPLPEALVTGVIETDRNFDPFSDQQCKCTQDYGYFINYITYITHLEIDPIRWNAKNQHHSFYMKCTKCISKGHGQPNEEKEMFRVSLYWHQEEIDQLSIILTLSVLSCHDNIKYSITFYQQFDDIRVVFRTPEKTCKVVAIAGCSRTVSDCTTDTVPWKVVRPWLPTYPWNNNWRNLEVKDWRNSLITKNRGPDNTGLIAEGCP